MSNSSVYNKKESLFLFALKVLSTCCYKSWCNLTSGSIALLAGVRMFSFAKNNWSLKGKIVKLLSPRSYLVCGENGTVYRRNRIHLRNDKSTTTINYQKQYVKNDDEIINNNQTLLRRSTRIVRKPQRLIESM